MEVKRPSVLLVGQLDTRFSRGIFHGMVTYARQHTGWRLNAQSTFSASDREKFNPAAVLLLSGDLEAQRLAREADIPFVLVGHVDPQGVSPSVSIDERALGAIAAEYFAGLGLKHFAFIGHGDWPFVHDRLRSFATAVEARGYGAVQQLTGTLYDRRRRGRFVREVGDLLRALPRPCGLLAANDALGVEVVAICQAIGLRVPDDIAVVGVDDDEVACELSEVPLSSVAQPLQAIGYEAARLLHRRLQQPDLPQRPLFLPPLRVVPRASSDLIALDDADVVAALRLINAHFAEGINVDWVVARLPVARRSLERKFKLLVRRTILEQIHRVRLQKARELLAESDLGLEVVAKRSGFVNARWLADSFRRELGTSPVRYRRQFRTEA